MHQARAPWAQLVTAVLLASGGPSGESPANPVGPCLMAQGREADIEGEVALNGNEFNYRIRGPVDAPPVFFIHGLHGNQATWDGLIDRFAANYRVITYDQRGHGSTVARGNLYSNTTMARDLASLMAYLGFPSAHVVGHSMGGRTALKFAALFPERAKSVVVEDMHIDARPYDVDHGLEVTRILRTFPESWDRKEDPLPILKQLYDAGYPGYAEGMIDWMQRGADGKWRFGLRLDVAELYEMYALREDLAPTLQRIRAPVMFLQAGDGRSILDDNGARRVRAVSPAVELIKINDAEHSIHASHPEEFLQLVTRFVNQHGG